MTDYEIGDWIKVTDEEDYYNIKSIDLDSGYVEVQDVSDILGILLLKPLNVNAATRRYME